MKAIVHTQFGLPEVLHLADAPKPTPKDGEVLGSEFAGEIEAMGKDVTRIKHGDAVLSQGSKRDR